MPIENLCNGLYHGHTLPLSLFLSNDSRSLEAIRAVIQVRKFLKTPGDLGERNYVVCDR